MVAARAAASPDSPADVGTAGPAEKKEKDLAVLTRTMAKLEALFAADDDTKYMQGCKVLHKSLHVGESAGKPACLAPAVVEATFRVLKATQRDPARVVSDKCRSWIRKVFQKVCCYCIHVQGFVLEGGMGEEEGSYFHKVGGTVGYLLCCILGSRDFF